MLLCLLWLCEACYIIQICNNDIHFNAMCWSNNADKYMYLFAEIIDIGLKTGVWHTAQWLMIVHMDKRHEKYKQQFSARFVA